MARNAHSAAEERVVGVPESLCEAPIDMSTVGTMHAAAALRGGGVDAGDVDGAHLYAKQSGSSTYVGLTPSP